MIVHQKEGSTHLDLNSAESWIEFASLDFQRVEQLEPFRTGEDVHLMQEPELRISMGVVLRSSHSLNHDISRKTDKS